MNTESQAERIGEKDIYLWEIMVRGLEMAVMGVSGLVDAKTGT